ncbi:collagenase [Salmonella enterica subsp. arizonae]|uniref:Collagenase n=1 Tax=Salmonella enterica subsp. arizonae TaxID=59203 RepID=A0A379S2T0_SALER|nr:collagenase [Salmonella enterica subsp. arizonae]
MQLVHGDEVLTLKFDCRPCEMHVIGKIKKLHFENAPARQRCRFSEP